MRVKCFSMTLAPNMYPATAMAIPLSWEDSPMIVSGNLSLKLVITRRLSSSKAAGYPAVHCRRQSCSLMGMMASYALWTSSMVPPPVLRIMGFCNLAIWVSSGILFRSPEAILKAGTSSFARKSALGKSKAVENIVIPISLA